jgi:hypothetical protein
VDAVADFRSDQAAGLRRLLGGGQQLQVVTFVAGCEGVGRSVAVANIGVALARLGKEVLIIDEHASRDDIASSFGLMARYDLLNVVQREIGLPQVLLQPMHGLRILPAARAVKKLGRLSLPQQQTCSMRCRGWSGRSMSFWSMPAWPIPMASPLSAWPRRRRWWCCPATVPRSPRPMR